MLRRRLVQFNQGVMKKSVCEMKYTNYQCVKFVKKMKASGLRPYHCHGR